LTATRQQLKGDLEQFLEGDKIDPLGKKQLGRGHRDIRAKTWLDPDEVHVSMSWGTVYCTIQTIQLM